MSADTATTLGAIDDLSLRYINPDIDGEEIPKTPSGTIDLKTAKIESNSTSDAISALINTLKAGTVTYSRFSSGVASYDDKLGMRFFFQDLCRWVRPSSFRP